MGTDKNHNKEKGVDIGSMVRQLLNMPPAVTKKRRKKQKPSPPPPSVKGLSKEEKGRGKEPM